MHKDEINYKECQNYSYWHNSDNSKTNYYYSSDNNSDKCKEHHCNRCDKHHCNVCPTGNTGV
ncbi:hypothetical protein [Clostridium psychrophilum]|uniref:hypothetical protein n=1 Tax=Clostridium psychrophilum TaxID=132926 RepID=UPI001C0E53E8|nr:hypothetical protein [Clostridium psychrophilum]MBU3182750.1 hypothetical protein [Clostridium psychrophilum]